MAIAWDEHKPPEMDLIKDCVHCGFCLPTCPSYVALENENDSPRGRIVLMRIGHEEGSEVSPQMTEHFDNCLGCMACVTACPSGVQYDRLIEQTRPQIERHGARTRGQRLYRRAIFELFTHPGRLRAMAPLMALQGRLGINRRLGERVKQPHLRAMMRLTCPSSCAPQRAGCPRSCRRRARERAASASCRAASNAPSSATSTPPPCACSPPRAGRSTPPAGRAAAER
jgi:glycolate oxidase iron-sulfur subunit